MKWLASFLLAASVALAACNPDNVIPDRTYDWCYEFDFVNADPMAPPFARRGAGSRQGRRPHLDRRARQRHRAGPAIVVGRLRRPAGRAAGL